MIDYDSESARTLLAIASRRGGVCAVRCGLAFAHLHTAARLRRGFQVVLKHHRLTGLQFAILVVLFENKGKPISMAVLARDAAVSRSAVTDALDSLEALRLASRGRDGGDRRVILVRITATGRIKIDQAISDYLLGAMQETTTSPDSNKAARDVE